MNSCCYFASMVLFSFFSISESIGQVTSSNRESFKNTKAYFQTIGEETHLYTGKEYDPRYDKNVQGNPFFSSTQMQNGDLFYYGSLYENVPILYDIVQQEIVINRYNTSFRIQLLSEKVKYFTLGSHKFENITTREGKGENMKTSFYDVAFIGRASLLIKRIKRIVFGLKVEEPPGFVESDEFFIQNDNNFYPVESRNSLLHALADRSELIKNFIRKNKFRFKKDMEKELTMTVEYYSTLKK